MSQALADGASFTIFTVACLTTAYALAACSQPAARASTRLSAAFVIGCWQLAAAFLILSGFRLFRAPVSLLFWSIAALAALRYAARRRDVRALFARDIAAIGGWWRGLTITARVVVSVGAANVGVRVVHGLLSPPLSWDAQTYHLYRPAAWVHAHGFASTAAADASRYYSWFPIYTDAIWGWWLLSMHGDAATALLSASTWAFVALACYACAREIDVDAGRATAAAAALAFTPAVLVFAIAVYPDNLALALYLAAAVFLVRAWDSRAAGDACLAAAALAVAAGVRGAAVLPACVLGIICAAWRAPSTRARIAVLAVAIVGAAPFVMAFVATGSPMYPLTIRAAGRVLFLGNRQLDALLRIWWIPSANREYRTLFSRLFFPWIRLTADHYNFGLGPLLLVPAVIPALRDAWRSGRAQIAIAFLVLGGALSVASVLQHDARALVIIWWPIAGRLMTIAVAALVITVACWRSRASTVVLWLCAAAGLAVTWPHGISRIDVVAIEQAVPRIVVVAGLLWILRRFLSVPRWAVLLASVALIAAVLLPVRRGLRYRYYESAHRLESYDLNPLAPEWTAPWPVWEFLDRDAPLKIAATAGWDGMGHNWFRYPLFGHRLQNDVVYVPVTQDGSLIDYRAASLHTDCDAWLQRVLNSSVDYLVTLPPPAPENAWAAALPAVFVVEAQAGGAVAYRVNRGGASRCP